jgi:hypothetical protein
MPMPVTANRNRAASTWRRKMAATITETAIDPATVSVTSVSISEPMKN